MTKLTKTSRSTLAGLALVAGLGLTGAGSAHAGADVFWSIAMSQPGIHIGVSNAPAPVVVHAPRVHVPPRVVYVPVRPVYHAHTGYRGPAYGHWKHDHRHDGRADRGRDHDRHDRRDDHRGGGHERSGRGGPELHMGRQR